MTVFSRLLKATELGTRMLGMVGALLLIWIAFHVLSGGLFLTPRNLWNLSVQSSSVAIMAVGMVLVIVTRNIDLSVGSMLGFIGMVMGVTQANLLPKLLGFDHPATGEYKRRIVPDVDAVSFVPVDFGRDSLRAELGAVPFFRALTAWLNDGDPICGWLNGNGTV